MSPEEKALARAQRNRDNLRAWTEKNRAHVNARAAAWHHANRDAVNARRRERAASRGEEHKRYHAERYANDPAYRERKREVSREWRVKNRELAKARQQERYQQNRDTIRAREKVRRADPARREAARLKAAEWRAKNPQRKGKYYRARYLKSKYGLEWESYQQMLAAQDHRCAVCRDVLPPEWTCVDHCHTTGQVRDLLCAGCNAALGLVKERAEVLRAAAAYLEHHQRRTKTTKVA